MKRNNEQFDRSIDISEVDIMAAMKDIPGYIDISPSDFKEVFLVAYSHAVRRLGNSLKAGDIMTSPVHCVELGMDLMQTATFLADRRISGAPVVDADGRIAGVVSEKDFLARMGIGTSSSLMQIIAHCLQNKGCIATILRNHSIRDIMATPAITTGPEITAGAISALFKENQINRLPIIDHDDRPVGIVTRNDLVHSFCVTGQV